MARKERYLKMARDSRVVNKEEERKIIVRLHQRGEDKISPTVYAVGDVDDFELLFAISALAEKFANTENSRAKTSDEIINMISMAVETGVNGEVDEYARHFIMALKEIRARA